MKFNASDLREARVHTRDIIDIAESHFKTFPNDPNADILISKMDLEHFELLIHVAELYAEQKAMQKLAGKKGDENT